MTGKKRGIYYEMLPGKSTKENLVFVHGSGCNRKFLRELAKECSTYHCYLPDLPDHGKSENRNCTSVEDYIDAIADFVQDMENVTIIGHSLGGTIAAGVAARSIPSVKRCVIISSGAAYHKFDRRIYRMVERHKVDWLYLMKSLGSFSCPGVWRDVMNFEDSEVILKDFKIDTELDIRQVIPDIKIPTLIMVGGDDILTIPEYSVWLKEHIKRSKLVIIPGVRHMLPIAKKKKVAALIERFMLVE